MSGQSQPRDRTPIVLGAIAGVLAVAVAITLTIALTRPGAETPPASTPDSSTPAAPASGSTDDTDESPEPAETPATEAAGVALSSTGITIRDDAGESLYTYGWGDDAAAAVAALSDAFGAQPAERTEAGNGTTYPDYTVYQWPGFALYDMVPIEGGKSRGEYSQPSYLRYTANTVGDVAITTEGGIQIGATVDAVRALGPDDEQERGSGIRFVFGESSFAGGVPTYSTVVDTDGSAVTAILYFYSS